MSAEIDLNPRAVKKRAEILEAAADVFREEGYAAASMDRIADRAGASKRTDILRAMPWYMKAIAPVVIPLFFNSVAESAHNAVEACLRDDWSSPTYWEKPGNFERRTPIVLDESRTREIIRISQEITGS